MKIASAVFKCASIKNIEAFAVDRIRDIKSEKESAKFAALMVQKYGEGIISVMLEIFGDGKDTQEVQNCLHKFLNEIDPEWKDNRKERWNKSKVDYFGV